MKPVTIIIPSYCPDETVRGYETRCLVQLAQHTPKEMYDLIVMQGGDWSYPQKVNAAMTGVRTDYAVVLSNDVFVGPGWLPQLLSDYAAIENCGLLAPVDDLNHPTLYPTYNENWWACVLVEMWKWWKVGPLDESLPKVYHDQDWSIRCKQAGFEVCRTGNVVVEHVGLATRSRVGTSDDAGERAEMVRRYGCAELSEYVRLNPCV
jgi:GT2 family glycosyltransferase